MDEHGRAIAVVAVSSVFGVGDPAAGAVDVGDAGWGFGGMVLTAGLTPVVEVHEQVDTVFDSLPEDLEIDLVAVPAQELAQIFRGGLRVVPPPGVEFYVVELVAAAGNRAAVGPEE